jgi:ankyrin repeat protein
MAHHRSTPAFNAASGIENAFFDLVRKGDVDAVEAFLATRPEALRWTQSGTGQTALHTVAMTGHWAMGEALLNAGAACDARDIHGRTPLAQAARSGTHRIVGLLLDRGADIHATDHKGNTPLHLAAEGISGDTVIALAQRGADAARRNADGGTPVDVAWARGSKGLAQVIRRETTKYLELQQTLAAEAAAPVTGRDIHLLKPLNPRKRGPQSGR